MPNTIKSALFVDYDSFHRSLNAASKDLAGLFAQKSAAWIAAIEDGRLVKPAPDDGERRRILIRRCYADPQHLGKDRAPLQATGFEIIECPPLEGHDRNSAVIHMVLDMIDALEHPADYDEIILLSADADLTPVLLRLKAHDRTSLIFAGKASPASYTAIADAAIEEDPFVELLSAEEPAEEPAKPEPAAPAVGDRSAVETLARKIHTGTNVPMFSPRTFADMFRALAQEVAENGYHFQKTAENVTTRLTEAGRNANRRQVLFVVKGLALKGHVFSTTDTPEQLAEVFREQVLYLSDSAGVELSDDDKALLPSWIVGRSPSPPARPAATPAPAKPPAKAAEEPAAKKPGSRRRPVRPKRSAKTETTGNGAAEAPKAEAPKAEAPSKPTPPPEPKKSAPPAAAAPKPAPERAAPAREPDDGSSSTLRRFAEIKANTASRLAALKASTANRPSLKRPDSSAKRPEPRPSGDRTERANPPKAKAGEQQDDALESSILAAIAQAVDVLVEDPADAPPPERNNVPPAEADDAPPLEAELEAMEEALDAPQDEPEVPAEPTPDPEQSDGGDSDDIGDEIQRIIASYSRARKQD